jgi:hypothetical protein
MGSECCSATWSDRRVVNLGDPYVFLVVARDDVQSAHTLGRRVHEGYRLRVAWSRVFRVPFEARQTIAEVVTSECHFCSVEIVPIGRQKQRVCWGTHTNKGMR